MLNASRHHRSSHKRVADSHQVRRVGCSTPLGITGLLTCRPYLMPCRISSCSTPLGITGLLTRARSRAARSADVLNASRHHRSSHQGGSRPVSGRLYPCSTPLGITGLLTHGRLRRGAGQVTRCSTPLGITGLLTRITIADVNPASAMCSTPLGITGLLTRAPSASPRSSAAVLNASRHHRSSHKFIAPNFGGCLLCSTPLGITGLLTPGR